MAQLGDVFLDVVYSENPQQSVKSTDHPVEGGGSITDHIERQPFKMSFSGVCTGDDTYGRLVKLRNYCDNGTLLEYVYRNGLDNVIIESLSTTHDAEVDKAFKFQMTLKVIRVSKPAIIDDLDYPVAVHVRAVKDKKNKKGQQQTQPVAVAFDPKYALNGK